MEKAQKIIDMLRCRGGFDDIFGNIDDDIIEDILNEIKEIIDGEGNSSI